jgi:hypothetical protein
MQGEANVASYQHRHFGFGEPLRLLLHRILHILKQRCFVAPLQNLQSPPRQFVHR